MLKFCEAAWTIFLYSLPGIGIAVSLLILLWLFDAQIFIECGPNSFLGESE